MTLGQLHQGHFLSGRQPIGGALGTGAVIRQRPLEGRECAMTPFIEDAAAHAEADGHVGDRFAPEEGQNSLEAVFPGRACRLWGRLHGAVLLLLCA